MSIILLKLQALRALINMVQGCVENQIALFDAKVIDVINGAIRRERYPGCTDSEVPTMFLTAFVFCYLSEKSLPFLS